MANAVASDRATYYLRGHDERTRVERGSHLKCTDKGIVGGRKPQRRRTPWRTAALRARAA